MLRLILNIYGYHSIPFLSNFVDKIIYTIGGNIIVFFWCFLYILDKKSIKLIPFIGMSAITPLYNALDQKYFINIFGNSTQNILMNANGFRILIFFIITILMTFLAKFISRNFKEKDHKFRYIISVFVFNLIWGFLICLTYYW